MRSLKRYAVNAEDVHDACVSTVTDGALSKRLASIRPLVGPAAVDYATKASTADLYQIAPRKTKLTTIVMGAATREDLKNLYERHMVGANAGGRAHYDALLLSAPYERCPYCGLGQATTLDHYLPKSRYPQFSVTPDNLVPACKDCQGKKGRHVALCGAAQTLHPYFDDPKYFSTRWIFGTLTATLPTAISFHPAPPPNWSVQEQARAIAHFKGHNLAKRFAVEASVELTILRDLYQEYRDAGAFDELKADLIRWSVACAKHGINTWRSALFHTLAADNWYCSAANV